MMFERLFKWMTHEISNRSGLIATPTALLVDGSRPTEAPPPIRFPEWVKASGAKRLPPKAVSFLENDPDSDLTNAFIVDVERQQIVTQLVLAPKEVGEFAAMYLTTARPTDSRTLLTAPPWFSEPQWSHSVPLADRRPPGIRRPGVTSPIDVLGDEPKPRQPPRPPPPRVPPPTLNANGVVGEEKKPPQPPRLQALVALAEETASLQTLPVVVTAEQA